MDDTTWCDSNHSYPGTDDTTDVQLERLKNIKWTVEIINCVAMGLIGPCNLLGNSLVIASVATRKRLRTNMHIFLANLALADIMAALPFTPLRVVTISRLVTNKVVCFLRVAFALLGLSARIVNLLPIAVDRFIAVHFPLRYKTIMTSRRKWLLIGSLWAVTLTIVCAVCRQAVSMDGCGSVVMFMIFKNECIVLSLFAVSIIMMVVLYFKIYTTAIKNSRRLSSIIPDSRMQKELRVAMGRSKVAALSSLLFIIFWTPLAIVFVVMSLVDMHEIIGQSLIESMITLTMVNSVVNPVIYCWRRTDFRSAIKKMLLQKPCCRCTYI